MLCNLVGVRRVLRRVLRRRKFRESCIFRRVKAAMRNKADAADAGWTVELVNL